MLTQKFEPLDFNPYTIRMDFPILGNSVHNTPLIYLDNGATTQKPSVVIETMNRFYAEKNSSIHRGVHFLSEQATTEYERARSVVQRFLGAAHSHEIVFTAGTTASINAVAFSFGESMVKEGDEIILTAMEHHANIVPWQMMCERKGAHLRVLPMNGKGELRVEELDRLINRKTRLLAIAHVSNTLGTINPVKEIIRQSHGAGVPVLVDGAQAVQHGKVDVRELDCDFYAFSGHKVFGPTGIGVLYGKEEWLDKLPPYQGGGDMVDQVDFDKTTFQSPPLKFEAGTTHFVGAIGLAAALEYLERLDFEQVVQYEQELLHYAHEKLLSIEGVKIYGEASRKISIVSFLMNGIHPYDVGMVLDKLGIAVRTGTHCAQPVMKFFGIDGTLRASMVFYNLKEEIDALCEALIRTRQMFT